MDDAFVEYVADMVMELQTKESSELPALRQQLIETEKGIENMLNAIQAGVLNSSTKQRLDDLEKAKERIELSIAKEEMQRPMFTQEQVIFWLCRFRKLDVTTLAGRRKLIDSFVNSVVVYDEHILITFNYKDSTKTVSFRDIESSDLSSLGGPKKDQARECLVFLLA